MLDDMQFVFTKKGNSWKTTSPITDVELECTVDLANGYLEVTDQGTGGGSLIQEVALFISGKGESFIGVSITTFDGARCISSCNFYRWNGKGWYDATVLPYLPLNQFFKPGFDLSAVKDRVSLSYKLPRNGTTVIAKLDVSGLQMAESGFMGAVPDEIQNAKRALSNIVYKSVELLWNMDEGVFTVGKKRK
jgi:hypothetical protein